ncbi:MAG: 23S rRNA (pseudouridine(1915)-N(3))-methyltransferase RlmH [Firmicutes bacterium]|nr:23S rRNA (pseudouridine(1915)-N(3))-methyltransferase RlmH [Bacillota bacterium]
MRVSVIAVGKLKEKYLLEAQREYLKRLRPYARMEITEVADESCGEKDPESILEKVKIKEGQRIIKALKPDSFIIALDRQGQEIDSESLARKVSDLSLQGKSYITCVIGGSLGLSGQVLQQADWKLSFSRLTFPHQLMRVILLEQIYRCFKIIRHEPYHK